MLRFIRLPPCTSVVKTTTTTCMPPKKAMTIIRTASTLSVADLPCPPADSPPYPTQDGLSTHLHFFMGAGGTSRQRYVFDKLYEYGDIVRLGMPGGNGFVVVYDPNEMLKVHRAVGPTPIGSTVVLWPFMKYWEERLANPENKTKTCPMSFQHSPTEWKRKRHALQKNLFGISDAKSYIPALREPIRDGVKRLPQNEQDLLSYLNNYTFEMIHMVLLGSRANAIDPSAVAARDAKFVQATKTTMDNGGWLQNSPTASMIPMYDYLPDQQKQMIQKSDWDMWHSFKHNLHTILTIGGEKTHEIFHSANPPKPHGVDPYVKRLKDAGDLNEEEINIEVAGLLQGGVDTTANTIDWLFTRLAQYPKVQEQARAQVREVMGGTAPDEFNWTADAIDKMPLVRNIVEESMRMGPTAGGHYRILSSPVELKDGRTGKEYTLPQGTRVLFSHAQARNDPRFVSEAGVFDPSRFDRDKKKARKETPESVIDHPVTSVFSWGPRMCLGARLAEIELYMTLGETLSRFKLEMDPPGQQVGVINHFLNRPDPQPMIKFVRV